MRKTYIVSNIYIMEFGGVKVSLIKVAKVTSNNSALLIYIPKAIREALNLRKGTYVKLKVEGNKLIVEPLKI